MHNTSLCRLFIHCTTADEEIHWINAADDDDGGGGGQEERHMAKQCSWSVCRVDNRMLKLILYQSSD